VFTLTLAAASIDGKWSFEGKMQGKKGGEGRTVETVLDLKAEGTVLKGTVKMGMGGRGREVEIQNGKVDGDKFSFMTVTKNRQGEEMKIVWEGTVEGGELKGTRMREGAKRGQPFTAKKQ
jgi:hypothetical protein